MLFVAHTQVLIGNVVFLDARPSCCRTSVSSASFLGTCMDMSMLQPEWEIRDLRGLLGSNAFLTPSYLLIGLLFTYDLCHRHSSSLPSIRFPPFFFCLDPLKIHLAKCTKDEESEGAPTLENATYGESTLSMDDAC